MRISSPRDYNETTDVVCQALPLATDALHLHASAEKTLRSDLKSDTGDLASEDAELVDHGVDRLLELGDFSLGIDVDLLAEIAVRDRRGDSSDGPNLVRQAVAHLVDLSHGRW